MLVIQCSFLAEEINAFMILVHGKVSLLGLPMLPLHKTSKPVVHESNWDRALLLFSVCEVQYFVDSRDYYRLARACLFGRAFLHVLAWRQAGRVGLHHLIPLTYKASRLPPREILGR